MVVSVAAILLMTSSYSHPKPSVLITSRKGLRTALCTIEIRVVNDDGRRNYVILGMMTIGATDGIFSATRALRRVFLFLDVIE
jgi:hypothetical protein